RSPRPTRRTRRAPRRASQAGGRPGTASRRSCMGRVGGVDEQEARRRLDAEEERLVGLRTGLTGDRDDEAVDEAAGYQPSDAGTDVHDRSRDLGLLELIDQDPAGGEDTRVRLPEGN